MNPKPPPVPRSMSLERKYKVWWLPSDSIVFPKSSLPSYRSSELTSWKEKLTFHLFLNSDFVKNQTLTLDEWLFETSKYVRSPPWLLHFSPLQKKSAIDQLKDFISLLLIFWSVERSRLGQSVPSLKSWQVSDTLFSSGALSKRITFDKALPRCKKD